MMRLCVDNLQWEYNLEVCFMMLARFHQVNHLDNSRNPTFVSVLALHGNVRGQGDQHYKGTRKKKKKRFRERCRFLSEALSLSVLQFWMPSYWDCTLMRIMEMCMMDVSCNEKQQHHKIYLCLSLPLLYQYQIRAVWQLPKVSWTEALVLMFGDLWAAARAVSLCKACDTATGGHCQAGLSQRVLLFVARKTPKQQASAQT